MHEIRIHGRGGQGAVIASKILAKALVEEGKFVTAIPAFGFERRGAPVAAFMRFDEAPIRRINNIYTPNTVISIDPSVIRAVDIFEGMQPGGTWVHTTRDSAEQLDVPEHIDTLGLCDAVGIAMEVFGRPITNTIMLGAFAKTTGAVSLDALKRGLASANFRDAGLKQNLLAVERGYAETRVHHLAQPDREAC
ncbi:NADH-dependent phenylglyoxylate dehydrogenase subunit gamma [Motiliproteus sp. SC1-56]|uniref:NADH-dependent phenylglyoxylate dehydrogenase subunit gamma n=1 Tax=Motiliproteus sp. SC1-56 TaxID=2799565 RepID=UPI001A8D5758|nr:2-oxoacid:acceptor oxidoreductase family protein [Motiliproteus sp. SC1-56]